jgi:hypothetical protein
MGGVGSGAKKRIYPPEIVALAVSLYEAGHTIVEVQSIAPQGVQGAANPSAPLAGAPVHSEARPARREEQLLARF